MDIGELISNAPDLAGGLQELGLDQSKVGELGQAITGQLAGEDGLDIGDLLSGFDAQSFLSRIDVSAVAEKVGISPEIAQTAIDLIAPKIAEVYRRERRRGVRPRWVGQCGERFSRRT